MSFKTHVFVCTNAPDREGKCGHKNSEALRQELKKKCGERWGKQMRVNSSGCLGFCERGIAAVIYPQGEWLLDLESTDTEKVFNKIEEKMRE